jgi:hypothetical protein
MKSKKKVLAAAFVLILLLQCLFTLPLAAATVYDGSGTVIAVLSGGFAGTGDARFRAVQFLGDSFRSATRRQGPHAACAHLHA